jgi:hypothetical protein
LSELLHQARHQFIRLLYRAPRFVDKSRLDILPLGTELPFGFIAKKRA